MTDSLLVIWQNVKSRQKYQVGTLEYLTNEKAYSFTYAYDVKHRGLEDAIKSGFNGIYCFELRKDSFLSKGLFHFFKKRLPNPSRADYPFLLNYFGLKESTSEMEFLRRTKGRIRTDSYELLSPIITLNQGQTFSLDIFIEGWRYYDGENVIDSLKNGDALLLEKDFDNPEDSFAVTVKTKENYKIGYIPAVYSEFISMVLEESGMYQMHIVTLNKDAIPQLKVAVKIVGSMPSSMSFQTDSSNRKELIFL